ncbi:MAG: tetratricopeptide repeat protein [Chitinophagaceae bacterium]|nr:tetratricopeptide repeat protein [Chitinophagaceae bacterium]
MFKYTLYIFSYLLLSAGCRSISKPIAPATATKPGALSGKAGEQKEMSLFLDAEKARLCGDTKGALKLYTDYLQTYTHNATAYYNTARLHFQKQEIATALKYAEKATQLDSKNKYFQELYTQLLVYNNNTRQAESQYNTLISNNPANDEYIYKKAMLYIKSGNFEKALETLTDLEKKIGFNEDVILQKKALYQRLGKTELAITELKRLRDADPSAVQYTIMMVDVYETGKQAEKAKAVYEELESRYPDQPLAQVALAQYYLENKNADQYYVFMQKVMRNKNLDVDTKISLIAPSLQKLAGDSTEEKGQVIEMAKVVAEESPDNKDAISLYADILYFSKHFDEALVQYKKYLLLDKSKYDVWGQVISLYMDQQLHDSTLLYAEQSIELFPNNPLPYFFMGYTFLQKKESEKAIKPLNKAADLEPENATLNAQIYASLGEAYHAAKKYDYSDSCYEKALRILPDDATTLNNFAYYLSLRKNKLDKAEKMSKKSLELQPGSKSFLDTYGWILFQQGKYTEAKDYIEQAIKAGGEDDGTLFDHLGDIYFKLQNTPKAMENWQKAKAKGENTPLLNKKIKDGIWYEE